MLAIRIMDSDALDSYTEEEMRRWWRHHCKKHVRDGIIYFEVPGRLNLYGGIKRLASFGVPAKVVRFSE